MRKREQFTAESISKLEHSTVHREKGKENVARKIISIPKVKTCF